MGVFRKMIRCSQARIVFFAIAIAVFTLIINVCIFVFFSTGITLAVPQYRLANTQWVCEMGDEGELTKLTLEFNKNGTILASRERGYEFVKKGLKWKKFDYATVSGENVVVTGKVYELKVEGDVLTITEKTEFSNMVVQNWICHRLK